MEPEPSRRSFITAVAAAAATTALGPAKARAAPDQAGSAYRSAGELVPALAGRQVSSRELVVQRDCPDRGARPQNQCGRCARFRPGARRRRCRRRGACARRAPAIARAADDRQGAIQHCRPADHLGATEIQGLAAGRRWAGGAAAQGGRRDHPRQDECAGRSRRLAELQRGVRHHQQSLGFRPLPGRLVGRCRSGACRWLRAPGVGLGHRRLAALSGAFLRRLLAQAEPRPGASARLRPAADPGHTGARRSRRGRADGPQCRRSRTRT